EKEDRSQTDDGQGPGHSCLAGSHPQRAESEDQEQDAEKCVTEFGRHAQEHQLQRDMPTHLENSEVVILEPVVDVSLRQHDEETDQPNARKEIDRRYDN